MTENTEGRLPNLPVPLFATVMGMAGLTLAWRTGEIVWDGPSTISAALTGLTTVLFIFLAIAYLSKLKGWPDKVKEEFNHPVKLNFFAATSISLILLSMLWLPVAEGWALALWIVGVIAHLLLTLTAMAHWTGAQPMPIESINPAWFIPVVGNILIPLPGVAFGLIELSWFFFSIGLVFWIVLMTLVFYRFIFHDPLPERMMPTLASLLAPPAVGFLAWIELTGEVDAFARILYYIGAFLFLLLLVRLPAFLRLPFFLSWWAYSFPVAAFSIATMEFGRHAALPLMETLGVILLALTTILIVGLALRTLKAARAGEICRPE